MECKIRDSASMTRAGKPLIVWVLVMAVRKDEKDGRKYHIRERWVSFIHPVNITLSTYCVPGTIKFFLTQLI